MSASNATTVPIYGQAYRVQVPLWLNTLALNTSPGTLSATLVKDGAAPVASTNTPAQVGSSGWVTLDLTAAEMSYNDIGLTISSTNAAAVPFVRELLPVQPGYIPTDLNSIGQAATNSGLVTANVTAALALLASTEGIVTGSVVTTTYTPTLGDFETSLTASTAGTYANRTLIWLTGANKGVAVPIVGYTYTNTKGHPFTAPNLAVPSSGDTFVIV